MVLLVIWHRKRIGEMLAMEKKCLDIRSCLMQDQQEYKEWPQVALDRQQQDEWINTCKSVKKGGGKQLW
jgi:hypothetical protein